MTSLFFAVISVPPAGARTLQGRGDHRGVTLVWLWFLDRALGPRLGVRFQSSLSFPPLPPFISLGQQNGPTVGWRDVFSRFLCAGIVGDQATLYSKLTVSFSLRRNRPTNTRTIYVSLFFAVYLLGTSASVLIISRNLKYTS